MLIQTNSDLVNTVSIQQIQENIDKVAKDATNTEKWIHLLRLKHAILIKFRMRFLVKCEKRSL